MNRTPPAYDSIGTLDFVVYFVLRTLGLDPEPLRLNGPSHISTIALRNAQRFAGFFGERKIQAIKAVHDATGMGLRDAKEAVEQIYETYNLSKEAKRKAIIDALQRGDDLGAEGLMREFRNL